MGHIYLAVVVLSWLVPPFAASAANASEERVPDIRWQLAADREAVLAPQDSGAPIFHELLQNSTGTSATEVVEAAQREYASLLAQVPAPLGSDPLTMLNDYETERRAAAEKLQAFLSARQNRLSYAESLALGFIVAATSVTAANLLYACDIVHKKFGVMPNVIESWHEEVANRRATFRATVAVLSRQDVPGLFFSATFLEDLPAKKSHIVGTFSPRRVIKAAATLADYAPLGILVPTTSLSDIKVLGIDVADLTLPRVLLKAPYMAEDNPFLILADALYDHDLNHGLDILGAEMSHFQLENCFASGGKLIQSCYERVRDKRRAMNRRFRDYAEKFGLRPDVISAIWNAFFFDRYDLTSGTGKYYMRDEIAASWTFKTFSSVSTFVERVAIALRFHDSSASDLEIEQIARIWLAFLTSEIPQSERECFVLAKNAYIMHSQPERLTLMP